MKKKTLKTLQQFSGFIVLLFGALALVMLFLEPALVHYTKVGSIESFLDVNVTGFQTIFGKENTLELSTLGLITLIFLAGGMIVPVSPLSFKLKHLVAGALLIVAGVLFFVFPASIPITIGTYKAATPLILAGVFSLVGGVVNLGLIFLK